jgi:ABC-type lipoprotein export system ATPase subunit
MIARLKRAMDSTHDVNGGEPPAAVSIAARGLTKSFDGGRVPALTGVDLEVRPGERVAITGPTGCGKSTLLSLLALLDTPNAGELELDGRPAAGIPSPERWRARRVGIVFQFHHLLPHLTVEENAMLPLVGLGVRGDAARRRARRVVDRIGLGHRADFRADRLSGGERQMAAVARALVASPALILADEPTGSVDSATGHSILDLIFGWKDGTPPTLLLVTHNPDVADRADRVVGMRDGRVDGID